MRRERHLRRAVRSIAGLLAVGALVASSAASAADPIVKCRQTIVRGAAKLAHARLVSLRTCEDAKRVGKLPALGACGDEPTVVDALAKARRVLVAAVDRACGGADKRCGGADDLDVAALGWPSACPELEGSGCAAPLASCADVSACVACLADAAVTRGVALVYAPLAVADPKTQKAIVRCQKALAAAATKLADARLAVGTRCLVARLAGAHSAPCLLPGDGTAAAKLARARAKAETSVCKACGGRDTRCGGGDDLAPELVGVAPACPGVGACDPRVESYPDLVDCFACTAGVRVDCALAGAAPAVAAYPPGCGEVPPTPTPTFTPTPTLTASASPTFTPSPTPTATPVFCAVGAPVADTTVVTVTVGTGAGALGGASLRLAYPPHRVRLPGVGDDPAVRERITDLTGGALLGKGAPNNQDGDGDLEPDRLRLTLVSTIGVSGAIVKVTFDRCSGAPVTGAGDYACTLEGAVAPDGVTALPNAVCTADVASAP